MCVMNGKVNLLVHSMSEKLDLKIVTPNYQTRTHRSSYIK